MRKALSVLAALALALSAGVASAHDGHAHGKEAILGTVAQVHGDHLEVADPDGKTVSVSLTSATTYLRGDSEAKKADLKPGVRVAVETADGKSGLEARSRPDRRRGEGCLDLPDASRGEERRPREVPEVRHVPGEEEGVSAGSAGGGST
ncbi:MAG: hypothetical protein IPP07_25635 [Holophagales bacterium]|nr:hypothetical protein [Holophagales bacterium]